MRAPRENAAASRPPRVRKDLNADAFLRAVRASFEGVADARTGNIKVPMADALMSAFAMFSLKDPSLLAFENRRCEGEHNLHTVYGIGRVPCDTQMRTICDEVSPDALRPAFQTVFRTLQRGKALEPFVFLDGHYLLSLDGTGFYSSENLGSAACLTRVDKKTGQTSYRLQMLGACLVSPDKKEVIALFPELITNRDGQDKNDCERNAARRWLEKFREDHPHLPVVITEDALSPNGPHIRDLQRHDCRFLLGVKSGDHALLFDYVEAAEAKGLVTHHEMVDPKDPRITHRFRILDEVPLNQSNLDLEVTFVEYWEVGPKGTKHFAWVTDLTVTPDNVYRIMRGGRARWRIENETFNTLKNQGYHLEHNYGLGKNHLAGVFATLMMLAFLVDQSLQHGCQLFQATWAKAGSKRELWDSLRSAFRCFLFDTMTDIYRALLQGIRKQRPELLDSS